MNWRDGRPSLWGDAVRAEPIDYDGEIHAWKMTLRMAETALRLAETQADFARERIDTLKRDKAKAMLVDLDCVSVPAAG